ncbi:MAG: hypothetical protein ABIQ88_09460 [Chitinophagaceae bacterium]
MKHIRILFLFLLPLAFMSCTNTREELEIKRDGSGTLAMKTDISKILELIKGFGDDSAMTKDGLDRPYDTTIVMKDYIDTAKDVPADKKELLRNGKAHVVLNMKESIGKIDMSFPFASTDKIADLYASLNSSGGGLKSLFDGMGKNLPKPGGDDGNNQKSMPQIASVYDIVVKDGVYSRKVNKQRYEEFTQTMKPEELKQMGSMLGAMDYTLSVKLPNPAKKVTNSKATLSNDKKTVTVAADLMEVFEHPELLALDIEY